jgi:tRNA uridine 5-carbamoylmethylation protein Kti12
MNLIFLYGPPATGKLTVAKELSRLLGYPVFHNHLTRDLVQGIYPGKVSDHYDLVDTLREDVTRYCAQHNTSIIFTFVYDGSSDDSSVARIVQSVQENGGNVCFVELSAPHDVILERVTDESRKQHRKIVDREKLASLLKAKTYVSMPYDDILKIDTSAQEPNESAVLISRYFGLSRDM